MSAIQLTGSDRWEVLTPISAGKEDQGVVHIPNSGIITSNGQYVLPIGSIPSQPIYVTATGSEAAANGVSGIQYQVKTIKEKHIDRNTPALVISMLKAVSPPALSFRSSLKSKMQMGQLQDSPRRVWMTVRGRSSYSKMAARAALESAVPRRQPQIS